MVLDAIGEHWGGEEACLVALVNGWEHMLAEPPLARYEAESFALGRAAPFAGVVRLSGEAPGKDITGAARLWALVDAAAHLSDADERAMLREMAGTSALAERSLPPDMRGLAVLSGLARRALHRGDHTLMAGRAGALVALRLGIFGR